MSQQLPQRPQANQGPIKYGDVFNVSGEVASKPIAPRDAATMQAVESIVLGGTNKGGPAAIMQSAATVNESRGVVGHGQATDEDVTILEEQVGDQRVLTESVGGQVVGQYIRTEPVEMSSPVSALDSDPVTIGETLEAASLLCGDKPVDQSDAAAIQAAEIRAKGDNRISPGGVAAAAQSAANLNVCTLRDEDKTTLSDVLADATTILGVDDKPVTREDAEGVIAAEIRNIPDFSTHPGGVGAHMAVAARLNQGNV